jgi:hypothetical protein
MGNPWLLIASLCQPCARAQAAGQLCVCGSCSPEQQLPRGKAPAPHMRGIPTTSVHAHDIQRLATTPWARPCTDTRHHPSALLPD